MHTLIEFFKDWILHLDKHLEPLIQACGPWTYLLLFLVIFCETGLVVTPFLPGDSLLFAVGSITAEPEYHLNATAMFVVLCIAAIAGDTVNYWIGAYIGPRAFTGKVRFLKKEYLERTHRFFEKYGGKAIVLARFVPIIRTFAPFVAGIGAMSYGKFIVYNVAGGIAWIGLFLWGGYWFGTWPWVKEHRSLIVVAIIVISVLPIVVEYLRARYGSEKQAK